jgi:hypothetical protein
MNNPRRIDLSCVLVSRLLSRTARPICFADAIGMPFLRSRRSVTKPTTSAATITAAMMIRSMTTVPELRAT